MRGYEIGTALRREADDVAREDRAALMREAAREIERLIGEVRASLDVQGELVDACNVLIEHASATHSHFESERGQRDLAKARMVVEKARKGAHIQ